MKSTNGSKLEFSDGNRELFGFGSTLINDAYKKIQY